MVLEKPLHSVPFHFGDKEKKLLKRPSSLSQNIVSSPSHLTDIQFSARELPTIADTSVDSYSRRRVLDSDQFRPYTIPTPHWQIAIPRRDINIAVDLRSSCVAIQILQKSPQVILLFRVHRSTCSCLESNLIGLLCYNTSLSLSHQTTSQSLILWRMSFRIDWGVSHAQHDVFWFCE